MEERFLKEVPLKNGRIIKLTGGLYTVMNTEDGSTQNVKARGLFRHTNESPKVGDFVTYDDDFIRTIEERENSLLRPPIANVDQAILIQSAKKPDFQFTLLDQFLLLIEHEDILPVIVINKIDLLSEKELMKLREDMTYYQHYYEVYYVSAKEGIGLDVLPKVFEEKVSVFAGQTGAGKSSLLNALDASLDLETNEISKALGRGKHTTRHTELIPLFGGLIADTPGFSKLDFSHIGEDEVAHCFVDFFERSSACKFRECKHINEPKCAVKDGVEKGEILPARYDDYLYIMNIVKEPKNKR
jgi:ribosome biogenesis GTPase